MPTPKRSDNRPKEKEPKGIWQNTRAWFAHVCSSVRSSLASWRKGWTGLLFYPEYSGSFSGNESAHLQQLAEKFFQRGRMFFGVSLTLLVACFVCVGFGVATFLYPTYWTDVNAADSRLEEIKATVAKNVDQQRDIEKQAKDADEFKDGLALLRSFYEHLSIKTKSYERDPGSAIRYEPPREFHDSLMPYLEALQSGAKSHTITFVSNRFADDKPQMIGEEVMGRVRELIELRQAPVSKVIQDLKKIKAAEDAESIKAVMKHLSDLKPQLAWIVEEFNAAADQLTLSIEAQKEFLDTKFDLQSENAMLGIEGAKLITQQVLEEQSSAWERWLPVLSIRVGVVILFLFLTRILLETYRYTTALSAFYRARGDALQMLGEGTKEAPLDSEQFAKLLIALAPENYRIDKIDSPENNLLALLRPGAGLTGK